MTAKTAQLSTEKREIGQVAPISKEDFLLEYSDMEDGYKYEWNNGKIEKTTAMNQYQSYLYNILNRLFNTTKAYQKGDGFFGETDMNTSSTQLRRPDLSYYRKEQISKFRTGDNQVAPWVAEVVSDNDNANKLNDKIEEYFNAGVQVVWIIYPHSKQVNVYTAIDESTICRGKTVCSGAPAIEGFEITAEDLFA